MNLPIRVAAIFALCCASPVHAQLDKHPRSVTIMTALPKDKVFVGAGYTIGEANLIAITTAKRTFKNVWDLPDVKNHLNRIVQVVEG